MSAPDLVIRSRRVVRGGRVAPSAIHVAGGKIVEVADWDDVPKGVPLDDRGERALLPGTVDTHVHVNEPGRADWEGFETATRAAVAGGVTTIVDMPLNSIPATTTVEALRAKERAAEGHAAVDYGFWGGVVPGNAGELDALADAGVLGFKCFLVPSGVEEFAHVGEADLRAAMPILARRGAPLLVHAEAPAAIDAAARDLAGEDFRRYATYLRSRPPEAEREAIELVLGLARETGCRVHIVHLSAADALPAIAAARKEGVPVTVETCAHYLTFAADAVPDRATEYKCAPPIRDRENRDRLWAGLAAGTIDLVASDHSPCPPHMKDPDGGDFSRAWGGIASLQVHVAALWTAARAREHGLERLARWTAEAPARLAGIDDRKGAIEPGRDADIVVMNPEASFRVDATRLHHRHKVTPYAGLSLDGVVEATYVRGRKVYDRGELAPGAAGARVRREFRKT